MKQSRTRAALALLCTIVAAAFMGGLAIGDRAFPIENTPCPGAGDPMPPDSDLFASAMPKEKAETEEHYPAIEIMPDGSLVPLNVMEFMMLFPGAPLPSCDIALVKDGTGKTIDARCYRLPTCHGSCIKDHSGNPPVFTCDCQ